MMSNFPLCIYVPVIAVFVVLLFVSHRVLPFECLAVLGTAQSQHRVVQMCS